MLPRIMEDPWLALRHEIDRSRRHEHPATLLWIAHERAAGDRRSVRRKQRDKIVLVERLRSILRSIDVVWEHRNGVYALLPETDRPAAEMLVARLRREIAEQLPAQGVRMACFPEDGVTANALRDVLDAQENPQRVTKGFAAPAFEPAAETERSR